MNDFEIKSAYEKDCIEKGLGHKALKAAFESNSDLELRNVTNSKYPEEDWAGIDVHATVANIKTFDAFVFKIDYKFRQKSFNDVLFNLQRKDGKDGWAINEDKKFDYVCYVNEPLRKVCLLPKQDMLDAKDKLKSWSNRQREKDGQYNAILDYSDCKELLPNFIGPIDF